MNNKFCYNDLPKNAKIAVDKLRRFKKKNNGPNLYLANYYWSFTIKCKVYETDTVIDLFESIDDDCFEAEARHWSALLKVFGQLNKNVELELLPYIFGIKVDDK